MAYLLGCRYIQNLVRTKRCESKGLKQSSCPPSVVAYLACNLHGYNRYLHKYLSRQTAVDSKRRQRILKFVITKLIAS